MTRPAPAGWPRVGTVPALLAAAVLLVGGLVSASLLLTGGPNETAQGVYVGETSLAYWQWGSSDYRLLPAGLPPVSTSAGTPTVLSATAGATLYRIGAATAGNLSVEWNFTLTSAAPGSTEIEVAVTGGGGGASICAPFYVETPAGPPRGPVTDAVYLDLGPAATNAVVLATLSETSRVCTSIGTCP